MSIPHTISSYYIRYTCTQNYSYNSYSALVQINNCFFSFWPFQFFYLLLLVYYLFCVQSIERYAKRKLRPDLCKIAKQSWLLEVLTVVRLGANMEGKALLEGRYKHNRWQSDLAPFWQLVEKELWISMWCLSVYFYKTTLTGYHIQCWGFVQVKTL